MRILAISFCSFFILISCSSKQTHPQPHSESAAATVPMNPAAETYNAIEAPEKDARPRDKKGHPSLGAAITTKTVGGLNCEKVSVIYPGAEPKYSCTSKKKINHKAIFQALKVEEKTVEVKSADGSLVPDAEAVEKTAGGLSCRKTSFSTKTQPKYECSENF